MATSTTNTPSHPSTRDPDPIRSRRTSTVTCRVSGTASFLGTVPFTGTAEFSANETTKDISVNTQVASTCGQNGSMTVTIISVSTSQNLRAQLRFYTIGTTKTVTLTIADNDHSPPPPPDPLIIDVIPLQNERPGWTGPPLTVPGTS